MSKLTGNQEFNGDVYVKGVGGYDGITPEGTLQEFLNCENLTEAEWREIFKVEDVEEGLFILYIDDFPERKLDDIISTYGAASLDEVVEMIANDPLNTRGETEHGVNFGVPTCETLEYEGETYRVYKFTTRLYVDDGSYRSALLPTSITYTELFRMSMQYNSENRRCPFVMISMDNDHTEYEPSVGLDEAFSLVCVKQIAPWKKPIDTTHSEEITYMYMDNFTYKGLSLVQVIKQNGDIFDDYLSYIKENPYGEGAGNRFTKNGTIEYEGVTYDIWTKTHDDGYGGLAPQNLKYSKLYPRTLECDSANAFEPYCPFVAFYENGSTGRYDPVTEKYSNLIAIE